MTGRYKAYPEYKESGVNWLGDIPNNWKAVSLKRVANFVTGMTPSTSIEEYYSGEESEFPWVRPEDISESSSEVKASKFLTKLGWDTQRPVEKNSTLICCIGTIGKSAYTSETVVTNQQITSATFQSSKKYYYYVLLAARTELEEKATGNVVKILNSERLGQLKIPLSTFEEQQKIANFLDHETAKINTLITKQENLIELLKEKRQAVISHAVTKGLNSDAPMKDSGVEWLGEVPEHWTISPSKRLFPESKNRAPTSDMQLSATQDYGVISQKKFMQLAGRKVVQLNSNQELRKKVHVGDFVISMRSFQGGLERAWDEGGIRSSYVVLKPSETVNKDYFQYLFKSVRYIQAIQSTANFIRDGQDMNYQNFVSIDLPLPSLEEQEYIASYLRAHINKIDSLVEKAQKAISLMQERKIALISAAVTGKIDVRDWVASGEVSNG